jgi:hypothetical protein
MKLSEARCLITRLWAAHVLELVALGYRVADDEGMEHITRKDPTSDHMAGSLHHIGLAKDAVFYDADGQPLDKTEHHKQSGEMWEKRHPLCRWGGRFGESKPGAGDGWDGGHYSIEWKGRR